MISLESLQDDALRTLTPLLAPGTHVALLDFPRHQNAGDSFIWLGTLAYLKRLGVVVDYVADVHIFNADDLRLRLPEGPILITGGGNFGDRWAEHQEFREMIVASFPDRRIIQLPQSLDFESSSGLSQAQRIISTHPDLTLMFRQSVDMDRARAWFPSTTRIFCPDLALGLGHLNRTAPTSHDAVLLLREDSESIAAGDLGAFDGLDYVSTDWTLGSNAQFLWKLYRAPENVARVVPAVRSKLLKTIQHSYIKAARLNLTGAQMNISRGRVLVTDRLHGMFLGALMGIPTIALDNANGKVSGIFKDYMQNFPGIQMAESLDDAARKTKDLLSASTTSTS